jgi:hypothetical protein
MATFTSFPRLLKKPEPGSLLVAAEFVARRVLPPAVVALYAITLNAESGQIRVQRGLRRVDLAVF